MVTLSRYMASLDQLTKFPELVRIFHLDATFRVEGGKHLTISTKGIIKPARQAG
jgi:hypothetical protein